MPSNLGKIRRFAFNVPHGWNNVVTGRYDPGMDFLGPGDEHSQMEPWVEGLAASIRKNGHPVIIIEDTNRTEIDNKARAFRADYLWSYHFDASLTHTASGTTVFIPLLAPPSFARKAEAQGRAIASALGVKFRGVNRNRHLAVFAFGLKTCLTEVCFGDNPSDVAKWKTHHPAARVACARALLVGIQDL